MIADDHGVESIGGVMGGEASGCSEATTDVLVESALWDPLNIARTGRALGVNSDARYRFERGVDPAFTLAGLDLATRMIMELCGGEAFGPAAGRRDPRHQPLHRLPWTEVKRLTGLSLPVPEMKLALTELGFHVSGGQDRVCASRRRAGAATSRARPTSSRRSCASPASTAWTPCPSRACMTRSRSRC